MATLKYRLKKKNSSGTYDTIHIETSAANVLMSDGSTSVESEISTLKTSVSSGKASIASAVTDKGVTTAADASFSTMATNIGLISTGTDTSDATAAAGDILSGKTAYVKGSKVTGTISSKAAATINTSTSNQTISAGQYLSGTQTIRAVTTSGIEAANIKSGVTVKVGDAGSAGRIKNITGTLVAGVPITLTVSVTTGATVTAKKGTTTVSGTSSGGSCTLELPSAGTWTVTATLSGKTDTGTVTVQDIYPLNLDVVSTASKTAKSGVTYASGLSGITPAKLSTYANAISKNSAITKTTSAVYIDDGSTHIKLSIGDTVSINIGGTAYSFLILGFNHDDLTDSTAYGTSTATSKAGITFQLAGDQLYELTYILGGESSSEGSWNWSDLRARLQGRIKGKMDDSWAAIIKKVNKLTSAGLRDSTIVTTGDELFLLSEIELFNVVKYSYAGEGNVYAYWSANNTNDARKKRYSGSTQKWWLRSPGNSRDIDYCLVETTGKVYYNGSSVENGVSFAFCV